MNQILSENVAPSKKKLPPLSSTLTTSEEPSPRKKIEFSQVPVLPNIGPNMLPSHHASVSQGQIRLISIQNIKCCAWFERFLGKLVRLFVLSIDLYQAAFQELIKRKTSIQVEILRSSLIDSRSPYFLSIIGQHMVKCYCYS